MITFGIIGTGRIAGQFAEEAARIEGVGIRGVCARDFGKTRLFAAEHGIEHAYASTDELLADPAIDAVYIGTLHPTHLPYSEKCLHRGKHVLCEKPVVLDAADLEPLIGAAERNGLLFMEALTVGFNPSYQRMKRILAEGVIGDIVHVESTFGRRSVKRHKHTPELAGGALYDIAIYNVFLAVDLLGVPRAVSAVSRKNGRGVDGSVDALLDHGSASSSFYATMDSVSGETARIVGTAGFIDIPAQWTTADRFILHREGTGSCAGIGGRGEVETGTGTGDREEIGVDSGAGASAEIPSETIRTETRGWLRYEIEDFVRTIETGKTENLIMTHGKTIAVHETMDRIRKEAGIEYGDLEFRIY